MINNNILTGRPMTQQGQTGVQVVKFIPGVRVFMKAPDSITAAPVQDYFTKVNGVTTVYTGAGFTDMGIVVGDAKVTYSKTNKDIATGKIKSVRDIWIAERKFEVECTLGQLDDVVISTITGLTGSVIQAGSILNYQIGQEFVVNKALILSMQNVADGKEIQLYHPSAKCDFAFTNGDDAVALQCKFMFTLFTAQGQTQEGLVSKTIFA